jgi:hypothetical protein
MNSTETCRSAFQGHGSAWLGRPQAKGGETFNLSLIQTDSFYSFSGTAKVELTSFTHSTAPFTRRMGPFH